LRRRAVPPVPVVVITAKDLTDEDRRRLNGGVARVVEKARGGPEAVLAEVQELIGGNR
jgi:CheY-like chemotaxis protein